MISPSGVAFAGAFFGGLRRGGRTQTISEIASLDVFTRPAMKKTESSAEPRTMRETPDDPMFRNADRSYRKSRNDECDVRSRMSIRLAQLNYHCIACTQFHTLIDC
jgi:hypothetical protein